MRRLVDTARAFATLELTVRKRLVGLVHGEQDSPRTGAGSEPEEVVRYRPGEDDVRRIDWNVTARTGEPHVWRTLAEHEIETWVLVDETASMDFGTIDVEKGELAAWVTGVVGLLSDHPGNQMGVAHLTTDGLSWSPPLSPRRAAFRALAGLPGAPGGGRGRGRSRPDARPGHATEVSVDLASALNALDARHRRPGVRIIVSDFVEPDGAVERPFRWEQPLRRLAARHDVLVVEVVDPRELELPDVGPVVLEDPETGHRCEVWTSLPGLRERYADLAAYHRRALAQAVHTAGADHVVLRTDGDWVADLARYLRGRGRPRLRRRR